MTVLLKCLKRVLKDCFYADWDSRIGAARNVDIAYCGLNGKQEAEVLAAFAQWGLEQEEDE